MSLNIPSDPDTFEAFLHFSNVTNIRKSNVGNEKYRGNWSTCIIIFEEFRDGWLQVTCTRPEESQAFDEICKEFMTLYQKFLEESESEANSIRDDELPET